MSITEGGDCVIEKPPMATTGQTIKDGGPAFPKPGFYSGDGDPEHDTIPADGMSLRDWFAGMALSPTLIQAYGNTPGILASEAFKVADAMLAERDKQETPDEPD